MANELRAQLRHCRRVVVKVGSRALAESPDVQRQLVTQIAALHGSGVAVLLVSSGAIAIGAPRLGYAGRPREMARLQAAAAAGQSVLMRRYDEWFAEFGVVAAQVLLTHADLGSRRRANSARDTLHELLEARAVPIVNENDVVSTEEIRFGDNDQLAAMVAPMVSADLLVLLTDVDGVLGEDGQRISVMSREATLGTVEATGARVGSGGIESKLSAGWKAARSGATCVIARATLPDVLTRIRDGEDVGTLFPPAATALKARKHWIAYTLRPRGDLLLDDGAVEAVTSGTRSLLPVGVVGFRGEFRAGDAVRLLTLHGAEIGRGLTRMGTLELARAAGHRHDELKDHREGHGEAESVVVHKDDLVVDA